MLTREPLRNTAAALAMLGFVLALTGLATMLAARNYSCSCFPEDRFRQALILTRCALALALPLAAV
jgi:hypothetical protein